MFDKPNPNKTTKQTPPAGSVSKKEPEDIFADTDPTTQSTHTTQPAYKKPAQQVDSSTQAPPSPTQAPPSPTQAPSPPSSPQVAPEKGISLDDALEKIPSAPVGGGDKKTPPPPLPSEQKTPEPGMGSKKSVVLWIIIGLIVLVVLAVAAYFVYSKYFVRSVSVIPDDKEGEAASETEEPDANANVEIENTNTNKNKLQNVNIGKVKGPIDTDNDGLTDEEERDLGTNPRNYDTDSDGLFDREEVKLYKTDPNNPDTDGDGYLDGEEVKSGYNPTGSGKLFGIPG